MGPDATCMRGPNTKDKVSRVKETRDSKSEVLTCENRRRTPGVPSTAEPAIAPAPATTAVAIQTEETPVAARVAQNRSRKFKPGDAEGLIEPFERRLTFFFQEALTGFGVEANVLGGDVPRQLFLASDDRFSFFQARREECLGEVDLGEHERCGVLGFVALETVAVFVSAPDRPAAADEGGGTERLGAVDDERGGTLHDEIHSILDELSHASAELVFRHLDDAVLNEVAVELAPIGLAHEASDHFVGLIA